MVLTPEFDRRPPRPECPDAMITLAVTMCTRDGAAHVSEQIRSIGPQLGVQDELIICDDGSVDATMSIVRSEVRAAGLRARILEGGPAVGVVANVERALGIATKDVVVLADQDDVWREDKAAIVRDRFSRRPELTALFSDGSLIDAHGHDLKSTIWKANGVHGLTRRRVEQGRVFEQLLRRNVVTGATLAFRSSLLESALPFPQVTMHDYWLALVASCTGRVEALPEPLIRYRSHDQQLVGPEPRTLSDQVRRRRREIGARSRELTMFRALRDRVGECLDPSRSSMLDAKIALLARRANLPRTFGGRLLRVGTDLATLRYLRYGRGLRSAGRDILLGQ